MASDQLVFFASGLLGFGPSVAVLFHALRTYDYPHTEKAYFDTGRVFLALAVGMILGTASGALTLALSGAATTVLSLVVLLILLALFEEAFKLIYLNRKAYRSRFDTTFVGVTLGVGMAAIVGAGSAYVNGSNLFVASRIATLAVFSASLGFIHAATGGLIGYGCSRGDVVTPFAQAFVARILHAAMLVPFFVWSTLQDTEANLLVPLFALAVAAAFAALVYAYVYRTVLPATLPPDLRRERRRRFRGPRPAEE